MRNRYLAGAIILLLASPSKSPAAVVFLDTFATNMSGGSYTTGDALSHDQTSNSVNDYTYAQSAASANASIVASTAIGNSSPSMRLTDNANTISQSLTLPASEMASFDTTNAANARLTISFDFRVDSWNGTAGNNVRFTLNGDGTSGSSLSFAFGRGNFSTAGGGTDDDGFYAYNGSGLTNTATSNGVLSFGAHAGEQTNNDTGDAFFHVVLTYDGGASTISGTVAPVSDLTSTTSFSRAITPFHFSSADATDRIVIGSGLNTQSSTAYFDNLSVSVGAVPEPASLTVLGLCGLVAMRRRTRCH